MVVRHSEPARVICGLSFLPAAGNMVSRQLSILVVAALAAVVCADDAYKTEDGVLVLNKGNFAAALEQYEHVLVEFCELHKRFILESILPFDSEPLSFIVLHLGISVAENHSLNH